MQTEPDLLDVAAQQHGLMTFRQCRAVGLTADAVRYRIEHGRLRVVHRGVLAIAGAPTTWEQRVLAAVLAAGPDAVASHETAALLWGFPGVVDAAIEVTTARTRRARIRGVKVHRTLAFLVEEHTVLDGIPVTSFARTLVDRSGKLDLPRLGRALDDGLRRGVTDLESCRTCAGGLRPAPGRRPRLVQALLAARLPGYHAGDSDLELRFVRAFVEGGLGRPVQQHPVVVGGRTYRLDLAYPDDRIGIEIDGFEFHRERQVFDRDRRRANEIVVAGWTLLRFTATTTNAEAVAQVRAALGRSRGV